jgi:hypothetical protein
MKIAKRGMKNVPGGDSPRGTWQACAGLFSVGFPALWVFEHFCKWLISNAFYVFRRFLAVFGGIESGFRPPTKMSRGAAFEPEFAPRGVKLPGGTSARHSLRTTSTDKNRTVSSVRHKPNTAHNHH